MSDYTLQAVKLVESCHGDLREARKTAGVAMIISNSEESFDYWFRVKEIIDSFNELGEN